MGTAVNAKVMAETGQTLFDYTVATDSGDQTVFTVSGKATFSNYTDKELSVRPNGLVTGRNIISTHATDNTVTIAACTAYIKGVLKTVAAGSDTITRPATAVAKINSITITDAGIYAAVAGIDSTTTAFDDSGRGSAGQPPYIPADSIEVGQVRVVADTAAVITSGEIFQAVGTHVERYDYPTWEVNPLGEGVSATVAAKKNAHITMASTIGDAIHTGDAYKLVYIWGNTPIFSDISKAVDFAPAVNTPSLTSTEYYGKTVGSSTQTLGSASFKVGMEDGLTDSLLADDGKILTFKFYSNKSKAPYSLTQGMIGVTPTFPASGQIEGAVTIIPETKTVNFAS